MKCLLRFLLFLVADLLIMEEMGVHDKVVQTVPVSLYVNLVNNRRILSDSNRGQDNPDYQKNYQ